MKRIIAIFSMWLMAASIMAQYPSDALRYSMFSFGGTARFMGAAGGFGAIGADFSSLSTNPAGIGLYRSSEFTFSPVIHYNTIKTGYNGTSQEDDRYNLNANNLGIIFAMGKYDDESPGWKKIQMGFGFNKLDNYNRNFNIEGFNDNSSILNAFERYAIGVAPKDLHPFDTRLAWDSYLFVDTIRDNNGLLRYTLAVPGGGVTQSKYVETRGSQNEMVLSLGGNYNDRLFIGGTIGFPTIQYRENATYKETDTENAVPGFSSLTMEDYVYTSGTGVNFKLGIISRPLNWIRVGAAIHSPTFISMRDEYGRTLIHHTDAFQEFIAKSPSGNFDYNLRTPMRGTINLGFIFKQFGFIGIDYEVVDYSEAKFEKKRENFNEVNEIIREDYRAASNFRIGGELNLMPIRLRAGYALYGSPYKNKINDLAKTSYTFGIGFKDKKYFLDFAWVLTSFKEDYYLYNAELVNPVKMDNFTSSMLMTLGFRF